MLNVKKIKQDFKTFEKHEGIVYLDSAASSLKPLVVAEEVYNYNAFDGVNISRGVYDLTYKVSTQFEEARTNIAKFINANEKEVIFTSGSSMSLNLVAYSYGMDNLNEGDEVIVSELEHHSSILPWIKVCEEKKAVIRYIKLDNGRITVENFEEVLNEKTKVVALTHISNVMGYITPIKEIIELAHEKNAIVSVDGAQAIPHHLVDVKDLDCDFYSFSGHKMFGPTGTGILYGKYDILEKMKPIIYGGSMNENVTKEIITLKRTPHKFETGTPNIAGFLGLSKACDYLLNIGYENIELHEKELLAYAMEKLNKIEDIVIYNKDTETGIITFNIKEVHPHDAASILNTHKICLRAGHHCARLTTAYINSDSTLRASLYVYNDKNDIDILVTGIKDVISFFKNF